MNSREASVAGVRSSAWRKMKSERYQEFPSGLGGHCKEFGFCSERSGELPRGPALPFPRCDSLPQPLSVPFPALTKLGNYLLGFPWLPSLEC